MLVAAFLVVIVEAFDPKVEVFIEVVAVEVESVRGIVIVNESVAVVKLVVGPLVFVFEAEFIVVRFEAWVPKVEAIVEVVTVEEESACDIIIVNEGVVVDKSIEAWFFVDVEENGTVQVIVQFAPVDTFFRDLKTIRVSLLAETILKFFFLNL